MLAATMMITFLTFICYRLINRCVHHPKHANRALTRVAQELTDSEELSALPWGTLTGTISKRGQQAEREILSKSFYCISFREPIKVSFNLYFMPSLQSPVITSCSSSSRFSLCFLRTRIKHTQI